MNNTGDKLTDLLLFLKDYIAEKGFPPSVREICVAQNIKSTASVHYYLNKLEDKNLIRRSFSKNRAIEIVNPYSSQKSKQNIKEVPLVGKIACGLPITAIENIEDVYSLPSELFCTNGELFMLNASGESMINVGIFDKDLVVIKKQNEANNGEIVAVLINDEEATLKTYYLERNYVRLSPENDTMEDIIVPNCKILGVAVGVIHRFNK
ncbi:MAG: transcriptional repressor LexA [Clostridia bacterium]